MHGPVFRFALLAAALAGFVPFSRAQEAAPKLVRIVVPFSPGASNDSIARTVAGPLAKRLGSTVIVENRPGAAGVIGAEYVAKAPRDGSILLLTSSTFLTAAATRTRMPYDAAADFAPVALIAQNPSLLAVSAAAPFRSAAALLAAARAHPDEITYASAGVGSIGHLLTELMNATAKVRMRHVPYKGAANAAIDLAGGQIFVMVSSYSTLLPFIKSGKVRLLAVTSPQPYPAFPDVPPLNATLPGFSSATWAGVLAPAGTPAGLVERLNRALGEIAVSPELRAFLEPDGMMPVTVSPAAFGERVRRELADWKRIAAARGIVAD
ncbi:MAG: tripartite tricarboxylate transporter substrate binding protein [Burkholderiales bacterium]|nr:tripartite tricarboxylate transporter substrate binding protein [Burkholderiales bacterium]